jgi:2'-5' RNA ligase
MPKKSIIIFPQFTNTAQIATIRNKYDPLAKLIAPHITLVFPFDSDYSSEEIKEHVQLSMKGINPFRLVMQEVTGTQDGYLFLNVKQGNDEIIKIHDLLYKGILSHCLTRRLTYQPHVTVGRIQDPVLFNEAIEGLAVFNDYFETEIREISVEVIGEKDESIIDSVVQLKFPDC